MSNVKFIESQHESNTGRPTGTMSPKRLEELDALEAKSLLYQGVTLQDMMILFRMDRRTLATRIADVQPCGKRGASVIYQIRDVAPYLVKPAGSIEEFIKRMRPNDLPPLLTKEFWNGQNAKIKYMENQGDVWRTDKVLERLSGVFKQVKMSLLLIPDALARGSTLSDTQQQEVRDLVDGALANARQELLDKFGKDDMQPGLGDNEMAEDEDDTFTVPDWAKGLDDDYEL